MSKLTLLLSIATLSVPHSASAQDRVFADTVTLVVDTLAKGGELTKVVTLHENYKHDPDKAASVNSCQPSLLSNNSREVGIDWNCPEPHADKYTAINVLDGKLFNIDYQVSRSEMQPSADSSGESAPKPSRTAKRFSQAVKGGRDATLGGFIPMNDSQLADLLGLSGWETLGPRDETNGMVVQYWRSGNQGQVVAVKTVLHFNADNQPIGVWIQHMTAQRQTRSEGAR